MARGEASNARSRRTRDALLLAARRLLEERGSQAVTMGAVADRAEVSRRAVYLHFESRTALINALFAYVNEVEDFGVGLESVFAAEDAESSLRRYAEFLTTYVPRILAVSTAIHEAARSDPDAATHWETAIEFRRKVGRRLIGRIEQEGRLPAAWSVPVAEGLLLALVTNDVIETLLEDCAWSADQAAARLGSVLCMVLLAADST